MKIPKQTPDTLHTDPVRAVRPVSSGARPAATPAAGRPDAAPPRTDQVQISDEARARAAQLQEQFPASEASAPRPERSIAELRQRIHDGFYDTDAVIDVVARRLLTLGDLDTNA